MNLQWEFASDIERFKFCPLLRRRKIGGAMDMSGSAHFKSVPIIDVTKENVAIVGPMMRGGIIGSDFIAIDCVRISMKTIE